MPALAGLPVDQHLGNLEGKELRFGTSAGATFAAGTTSISCGSVNCSHDSLNPLAGLSPLTGMWLNCIYGGKGVGMINLLLVPDRRRVHRRADGRTHAGVPGQKGRGPRNEARHARPAGPSDHDPHARRGCSPPRTGARSRPTIPGRMACRRCVYEFSSASANNGSEFGGLNTGWGANDNPSPAAATAGRWDIATGW